MTMATWYYFDNNGQKKGPFSSDQLKELVKQGLVTQETVLENDAGQTGPARKANGLFPKTAQPSPPQPDEQNPFAAAPPELDNPFTVPMPGVKQAKPKTKPKSAPKPAAEWDKGTVVIVIVGVIAVLVVCGIGWWVIFPAKQEVIGNPIDTPVVDSRPHVGATTPISTPQGDGMVSPGSSNASSSYVDTVFGGDSQPAPNNPVGTQRPAPNNPLGTPRPAPNHPLGTQRPAPNHPLGTQRPAPNNPVGTPNVDKTSEIIGKWVRIDDGSPERDPSSGRYLQEDVPREVEILADGTGVYRVARVGAFAYERGGPIIFTWKTTESSSPNWESIIITSSDLSADANTQPVLQFNLGLTPGLNIKWFRQNRAQSEAQYIRGEAKYR